MGNTHGCGQVDNRGSARKQHLSCRLDRVPVATVVSNREGNRRRVPGDYTLKILRGFCKSITTDIHTQQVYTHRPQLQKSNSCPPCLSKCQTVAQPNKIHTLTAHRTLQYFMLQRRLCCLFLLVGRMLLCGCACLCSVSSSFYLSLPFSIVLSLVSGMTSLRMSSEGKHRRTVSPACRYLVPLEVAPRRWPFPACTLAGRV